MNTQIINQQTTSSVEGESGANTAQISNHDLLVTVPHHEYDMSRVQRLLAMNEDFLYLNRYAEVRIAKTRLIDA